MSQSQERLRVIRLISVKGGFFTANALAPTVVMVSISGQVLTASGNGLRNARVTLTDMTGNARTILTGKLGNFRFNDVQAGESYIISVAPLCLSTSSRDGNGRNHRFEFFRLSANRSSRSAG